MEYALKNNKNYESKVFNSPFVQTKGKCNIILQTRLSNNEFADSVTISKKNTVTQTGLFLDQKLVSKQPFSYDYLGMVVKYFDKKKIEDYLYEISYGNIDYNYAYSHFAPIGGCSAIRNCNFFGRNFDWLYNKQVQFVVHTPSSLDHYAVLGVSGIIPEVTQDNVDQESIIIDGTDMFKLVPFYLLDGINEKGIFCTHNITSLEDSFEQVIHAKKEEKDVVSIPMLVRFVLDKFSTAQEAVNYLINYTTIFFTEEMTSAGYQSHFMIGDSTKTYILEFIGDKISVICKQYITNFNITDVKFNNDGTVIYPTPTLSGINQFGFGLERWDIITKNYKTANTKEGMSQLLDLVKYSNGYDEDSFWYSELSCNYNDDDGELITIDTPKEKCTEAKQFVQEQYQTRDRTEENTWITCHSSVYDIKNKILYIKNQENVNEYKFNVI